MTYPCGHPHSTPATAARCHAERMRKRADRVMRNARPAQLVPLRLVTRPGSIVSVLYFYGAEPA